MEKNFEKKNSTNISVQSVSRLAGYMQHILKSDFVFKINCLCLGNIKMNFINFIVARQSNICQVSKEQFKI